MTSSPNRDRRRRLRTRILEQLAPDVAEQHVNAPLPELVELLLEAYALVADVARDGAGGQA